MSLKKCYNFEDFRIFGIFLTAGSVATFRYARRIALLPVGIIAQAVGVASYPLLSKLYQKMILMNYLI